MKVKAILSAVFGLFFGGAGYLVLKIMNIENALGFAVLSGLLFYLILFVFLIVHEKFLDKRYAEIEKNIVSPVFHKTNGNFFLGNGKVKNANIYFCEDGIALVSIDEKPYVTEEIRKENIEIIGFDNVRFNIMTTDKKVYIINMADSKTTFEKLKEKGWFIQE